MSLSYPTVFSNVPTEQSASIIVEKETGKPRSLPERARWIGQCKSCGGVHLKVEGRPVGFWTSKGSYYGAVTDDDRALVAADLGTNPYAIRIPCGRGHWPTLHMVHEGSKQSKHQCGARCTNATGPSCDCRCKGANHGAGAALV